MMPQLRTRTQALLAVSALALLQTTLAACGGSSPTGPSQPPAAAIRFTPATTPPPASSITLAEASKTSSAITLNVLATGVDGVASVYFDLTFNPAVVTVSGASAGPFLSSSGATVSFLIPPDLTTVNSQGRLPVGITINPATTGVGGSGVVCTISFAASGNGTSGLAFEAAAANTPFPVTAIPTITFGGGTLTVSR